MKSRKSFKPVPLFLSVVFLIVFTQSVNAASKYRVDPVHTSVVFKIKHLGITYVYGRFNDPRGEVIWDKDKPDRSSVDMYVRAKDVDTNNDKRDNHLRSPDFFNVKEHSRIKFKSNDFKKVGEDLYEVTGDLILHGVTKRLTVTVKDTGKGRDPWGGIRQGFETVFKIDRTEFGMANLLDAVGAEVELRVAVEGILSN